MLFRSRNAALRALGELDDKRGLDLAISLPLAVLLAPLLGVLALLVRWKLGSPALFTQERPGREGRLFRMVKFRSMTDARDLQGQLLPDEVRLTRFGRFLRASSLDELPELWNVIRGEMSLVGPRPLLMRYLGLYTPEQNRRHNVLPGVTGWAQVNGRNALSWEEKFAYDIDYVDRLCWLLDLQILGMTLWKVIRRDGVSATGHATMPEFRGIEHERRPDSIQKAA